VIAILLAITQLPSSIANAQTLSKEIFLNKEKYHLPIEAYEQRALYKLNQHIIQKHVEYDFSWPVWVREEHKLILKKEIITHIEVEVPSVSVKLKNKKQNSSQIVFTYDYKIPINRVYSISSGDVEQFINMLGSEKPKNGFLGLELFLAYPSIFKSTKQQKIERWKTVFPGASKILIFDLPIVSRKTLERSAIAISLEQTTKNLEEVIALFDLMPFNPSICNFISKKLSVTLPVISKNIQDRCPTIDIQNSKTYKLNRKSEIKQKEVVTEVQRLVAETELQLEKFPILTSILNSLGTRKLELKEFTEVSIQDLYGDQGVFFSIENFEKNYSLTRLSILSKQLKYGGYATLSKVIEKQIKFLSS
jgi:hypothetical protein